MEPRPFVRISVAALALRIPMASKASRSGVHASSSPCYCEIRLPKFPVQTAPIPLIPATKSTPTSHITAANFYLDEPALRKLLSTSCCQSRQCLEIRVYTGKQGSSCGSTTGEMLGRFTLPVLMEWAGPMPFQLYNGWVCIGEPKAKGGRPGAELHLIVKAEPDPRYIFEFDGEPEQSPQIVQIQGNIKGNIKGNIRQPIFTCKFTQDRCSRSRTGLLDGSLGSGWACPHGDRDREKKERKGWLIIIHDLSGSPVAAASMVTPFVPTGSSDRVVRSNPGAWLILRSGPVGEDRWIPWCRLEAWRERGSNGGLGCRFQLVGESGTSGVGSGVLVSETVINARKGGTFLLDTSKFRTESSLSASPVDSPRSSGDFSFSIGVPVVGGFAMSASIQGEGKCSKPQVQLAMRHISCIEDAAVFMALAAAVDLSMDACLPFSKKLGKGFTQADSS
eukprot:c13792_g1_i2 orf=428-1774(-)